MNSENCTRLHFSGCHADRDEIRRHAEPDFPALAVEFGARRRGSAWFCPFHEDRTPSASIRRGRFRCFGCNLSLDPIAFIQRAGGMDFKRALAFLAERYGVPLNRALSDQERRAYARERAQVDAHLPAARLWRRAALILADEALAEIKSSAVANFVELPMVTEFAAAVRRLDGRELVAEYLSWRRRARSLTDAMVWASGQRAIAERRALERFLAETAAA